jgi:hypothetical protein
MPTRQRHVPVWPEAEANASHMGRVDASKAAEEATLAGWDNGLVLLGRGGKRQTHKQ